MTSRPPPPRASLDVRQDVRLEDGPMQPVDCATCGAQVLARKSSWDQTTIQWTAVALERCRERSVPRPATGHPNRHGFAGCSALIDAVREAAVRGLLEVRSHEPLMTNLMTDPMTNPMTDPGGLP